MILCPGCGSGTPLDRDIQEAVFGWRCSSCARGFEVRIVFLPRSEAIDVTEFSAEVNRLLSEQGLSKSELAKLVGVTPAYISTLLSGRRPVSSRAGERIMGVLQHRFRRSYNT